MPQPHALILRAPGTNCDRESAHAFELAGARADLVHINRLMEAPRQIARYQILCLPGGFSYGDDVAAGRILASQIRARLRDALLEFKAAGKLALGICNGFQVLIKSGILLGDSADAPAATLTWNDSGKFEDRWVNLRSSGDNCVFLRGVEQLYLPIAHAEGKFVPGDNKTLAALENKGQCVLRYSGDNGPVNGQLPYPDNPNGSVSNIAGVCDDTGRIFGLMPHPERYVDVTNHPRWTRQSSHDDPHGIRVFQNAVQYFSES